MKNIKMKIISWILLTTFLISDIPVQNLYALEITENNQNIAETITDDDIIIIEKEFVNNENIPLDDTAKKSNEEVLYETIKMEETLNKLNQIDLLNIDLEYFEHILSVSTLETIGEWLVGLPYDDYDLLLSMNTSLNDQVYVLSDEGLVPDEADMLFYELAEISYWNTLTSTFSWNDRFQGGSRGDAKFRIDFYCDGERVGRYTVTASNVSQPSDGSTSTLSLSTISGSDWACSHGHDLNVKFSKIEAVTSSSNSWSGIRLFGQYTRPGHYIVTDGAINSGSSNYDGFWPSYFTRFGTNTYGTTSYSNKWCLDARYNSAPIVDEFALEGNMYVIGLYENSSINNYGYSTYFIELNPAGMTYRVNPTGGFYNGTQNYTTYTSKANEKEQETIYVPEWISESSGKTFIGWNFDNKVIVKDGAGNVSVPSSVLTKENITVLYTSEEDGKYISKTLSNREYGSYIEWNNSSVSTLNAQWQTDWVKVNFDGNPPSGKSVVVDPENKIVNYNQAYGELPTPSIYGYEFLGWYTSPTDGKLVTEDTVCLATGSHTLYAQWQKSLFTLTFDMNLPKTYSSSTVNGMASYTVGDKYQKQIWYNKPYGYIYDSGNNNWPTPSVSGLTFDGWYTHPLFGVKLNADTLYSGLDNITVYAQWKDVLLLDGEENLDYNAYIIGNTVFNKGGVDLNWHRETSGYYNIYKKEENESTWSLINQKTTVKEMADLTSVDLASPNKIDQSTISQTATSYGESITFDEPEDKGTTYNYYVDELQFYSAGDIKATKNYSSSVQSYTAPVTGVYQVTLYGAGSGSGTSWNRYGAKLTGEITLNANQTIYMLTGGASTGRSGGANGGGSGGSSDYDSGFGGGGATHLATTNRTSTSAFASYTGEIKAVSAGAGGEGGDGRYQDAFYDDGTSYGYGGTGGSSGNNGGNASIKGAAINDSSKGGYPGYANGTGGTHAYSSSSKVSVSYGGKYETGGGGGGGGGWKGGGGGTGGAAYGAKATSSYDNGTANAFGGNGGSGNYGTGGSGGNGTSGGTTSTSSSYKYKYPSSAGGGGGGAGGTSYNGLSNGSLSNGSNAGNGYVTISLVTDLQGTSNIQSNITTETVKTGIKGYRYLIDGSPSTTLNASSGTFTEIREITVPYTTSAQYLHIASQDAAGNISETIHVQIQSKYTIKYNLNEGVMPEGTDNPEAYLTTTPSFTLNSPEKEGYEFIGWTGSNGDIPQLDVEVTQGTVGDLEYTANWIATEINVDQIEITGSNIFTNKPQEWYVKAGTQFVASFGSYTNDKIPYFASNVNDLHIKNSANQHIQSIRSILMMETYEGTNGSITVNNADLATYISTENIRHATSQEFTTSSTFKLDTDKASMILYPQGHVITAADSRLPSLAHNKTYSSEEWDDTKKATVIADGSHPEILINMPSVFTEKEDLEITISESELGSGIKTSDIYITNISQGTEEVKLESITDVNLESSTTQKEGEENPRVINQKYTAVIDTTEHPDEFIGLLQIRVVTTDNVGNKSELVFPLLAGIAVKASVHTLLPDHSNTFKAGQRGYIDIELNGYIEYLTIDFEQEFEDYRTEEEGMECIPVFSNPDEQRDLRDNYEDIDLPTTLSTTIDMNETENGILASADYRYYFDVPINADEKFGYKISLYGININGDIVDTEVYFDVTESILDEFRTTIRNN